MMGQMLRDGSADAPPPAKRKPGRPRGSGKLRTPDNARKICSLLAEGYSLRQVANVLGVTASKISEWGREDSFKEQYARAMRQRCERMAEEIVEISDDARNDWMEREGFTVPDHESVQRSRLRVDTRKWILSKMLPKRYGDKIEISSDPDAPVLTRIELVAVYPKQLEPPTIDVSPTHNDGLGDGSRPDDSRKP